MANDFGPVLDVSYEAGEDLTNYQYHFVKIVGSTVTLLDTAFEVPDGILQNTPASGEEATVRKLGCSKIVANAALTVNTYIKPEFVSTTDCGKAQVATSNRNLICGRIVEASSAEDDLAVIDLMLSLGLAGPKTKSTTVTTETTAGAVTYTAAQIIGGLILRDPAGAGRADLFPTAANIIAGLPDAQVGDSFEFLIRNDADAAETITMTTNTGLTLSGTMTIAQNNAKRFLAVITSSSAVSIYSLGTLVY